jgi:16S rRNA (cytidine1402-2'-O)-methyltransferase
MLYVVATPIGNLGDMSQRAVDVLKEVDLIAAEDTRVTMKLLNHFDIRTPLTSLHAFNEETKGAALVRRMVEEGISVALVTDAGTPAVSDPGSLLIAEAIKQGIPVSPVPGASAAIAAVSVCGFTNKEFTFIGFLERSKKAQKERLEALRGHAQTVVLYESPFRALETLENISEVYPNIQVVACRDLTKKFEEYVRGTPDSVHMQLQNNPNHTKGEYVLVLDLSKEKEIEQESDNDNLSLEAQLIDRMVKEEETLREAMDALVKQGGNRNMLYQAQLTLKCIFE